MATKTTKSSSAKRKLTPKQQEFVRQYLVDLSACAAAKRAGYAEKSAREYGPRMLRNPLIRAAIDSAMASRSKRTEVEQDRVVRELALIALADIGQVCKFGPGGVTMYESEGLTRDQRAAVSKVSHSVTAHGGTTRVEMHDKLRALELLGRHLRMWEGSGADSADGADRRVDLHLHFGPGDEVDNAESS